MSFIPTPEGDPLEINCSYPKHPRMKYDIDAWTYDMTIKILKADDSDRRDTIRHMLRSTPIKSRADFCLPSIKKICDVLHDNGPIESARYRVSPA